MLYIYTSLHKLSNVYFLFIVLWTCFMKEEAIKMPNSIFIEDIGYS